MTKTPKHVINIYRQLQRLKRVNAFGISKFIKQTQKIHWT